ncbi:MAG: tetratricopeptide repeat protein [Pikeienuella sp.]
MLAFLLMACQPIGTAAGKNDNDPMAVGIRLMRAGEPTQALGAFNRALAERVTAEALTGAASAYHALGQRKQAKELLHAAIKRDPNLGLARNNLGILLYEDGDYAAAEQELRRAFAITGGADRAIATNLAFAEFALSQVPAPTVKDADAFDVIQYGHGLYRLERAEKDTL